MESSAHYFGQSLENAILAQSHLERFRHGCNARTAAAKFKADAHYYAACYFEHHAANYWSLCGMAAKDEAKAREARP